MDGQPVRVGLVGATPGVGWGPRAHIPAYRALPEIQLAAVCTAHAETAAASAREFGVPKAYHDYQALVADPEIDLISISTRVLLHHEISRAALQAGKAVYCEWPLGVDAHQAADLADLAGGGLTAVGLQGRVIPAILHFKQLLAEEYVGELRNVQTWAFLPGASRPRPARYRHMADRAAGADALAIHAGHVLDALRFVAGDFASARGEAVTLAPDSTIAETGEHLRVTAI